ncbi:MAG: response regulator transcription factor [Slackia sp.]
MTNRETDVLRLLARGRTSPFIQEELMLSRNTVKTHVRHIYTKLNVHSQQELISKVEQRKTGLE